MPSAGCSARHAPLSVPDGGGAMRAVMKGSMRVGSRKTRFEAILATKAPDRLRVEISGPIGGTRAVLAASGGRVIVLLAAGREYLDAAATPETYRALIGLPLTTAGLIDLFVHAGTTGTRRIALPGDGGAEDGSLMVSYEGDRIHATMGEAGEEGARWLELRVIEIERTVPAAISDDLFELSVPDGWTRIDPAASSTEGPTLLP